MKKTTSELKKIPHIHTGAYKTGTRLVLTALIATSLLAGCKKSDAAKEGATVTHTAVTIPTDLIFDGQPLDPVCLNIGGEAQDMPYTIDPANCRHAEFIYEEKVQPRGPDPENGFITVEYREADPEFHSMRGPFDSYRYIGALDNGHVVLGQSSGGGTGVFTSLLLLRREADKIVIFDGMGGGDRCNGGIIDAHVKDNHVHISAHATSYDIAVAGAEGEPPFNAYDDVDACAACCIGTVEYIDGITVGITLNQDLPADMQGALDKPMQSCFHTLYRTYRAEGKEALDMDGARAFSADFIAQCVK